MENNNTFIYSVIDLCNIFNIKHNTFPSIAKKLGINTSNYCIIKKTDYGAKKRYYNKQAYKEIEKYIYNKDKSKEFYYQRSPIFEYLEEIEKKSKKIRCLQNDNEKLCQQVDDLAKINESLNSKISTINNSLFLKNVEINKLNNQIENNVTIINFYKKELDIQNSKVKDLSFELEHIKKKGFFSFIQRNRKEE